MNSIKSLRTVSLFVVGFGLAVSGYSQSFLTNGLIAYYPFNGNANDASGTNNGTLTGTATFGVDRYSNSNACLSLPGTVGTGSAVDVPSLSNLPYVPVTYSAWFRLNGYPAYPQSGGATMTLLGREQFGDQYAGSICIFSSTYNAVLGPYTNKLEYFEGIGAKISLLTPPLSQWCQVVLTIDPTGVVNFYFNGTNVPSVASG